MTRLDVLSDVICPWCSIGKQHMQRALRRHVLISGAVPADSYAEVLARAHAMLLGRAEVS